ncbi:MAG: hypothetical protein II804_05970 [Clostridia bacterium]|nr:hypothetical protein [Clostridia bacterium]
MIDLINKIDAIIEKVAAASVWGYVKSVIDKVKAYLDNKGDTEAVTFVDILFG